MKLNLGSGISGLSALNVITMNYSDWKSIDICPDYKADEHYDISMGIREKDNSIEEIWMGDFFEHLLRLKAKFIISECFRVLKSKGRLRISVPDMSIVMPKFLEDPTNVEYGMLIFGDQDEMYQKNSIPSCHKWGYTEKSLTKLFKEAGFNNINKTTIHPAWHQVALDIYKD